MDFSLDKVVGAKGSERKLAPPRGMGLAGGSPVYGLVLGDPPAGAAANERTVSTGF